MVLGSVRNLSVSIPEVWPRYRPLDLGQMKVRRRDDREVAWVVCFIHDGLVLEVRDLGVRRAENL